MSENMTGKDILMIAVVRPFTLSFTEPMVFLLNLYIALIYGLLYIWFESFPLVFTGIYGFNLGEEGLGGLLTPKSVSNCADIRFSIHRHPRGRFRRDSAIFLVFA